ncbi:hypothetical protein F5883DRAFT_561848, partial [Diaporthe sp. PMI_573]
LPDSDGSVSVDSTDTADGFATHTDGSFLDLGGDQFGSISAQGWPASDDARAPSTICSDSTTLRANPAAPSPSSASSIAPPTRPKLDIPNFLGGLGEVQRVEGSTDSWRWVIGELKRCPRDLATRGETMFLHRNLYPDAMPRAIRAALDDADENQGYGCGGSNGAGGFSGSSNGLSVIDELARLQAFVLYQMMRMFGGGLEQRLVVEQQRDLLTTWALRLLRRSMAELGNGGHRAPNADGDMDSWHTWIVAESIRRTVMVAYMFYGVYSLATQGFCVELPTLAKLPVSKAPASWHSEAAYMARSPTVEAPQTLTYEDYTDCWMKSPPERVDPFDKFLMVPCKGLEVVSS